MVIFTFIIKNLTRILLDIERHHFIKFFVALQEDRPFFAIWAAGLREL